jgi:hypothetical protein
MSSRRRLVALTAALLTAALGAPVAAPAASDGVRTAQYLESVRAQPAKLRALLLAMPKGADLHNHLSGAVTTEGLIGLAVGDGLCIVTATMTAQFPAAGAPCAAGQRPAADTTTDRAFYRQVLQAWSMEGFVPGAETGHDHFFATFGKFGAATVRKGDMLAEVANINARQHVLYLETLASRQGDAVRALAQQVGFDPDFAALRGKLLAGGMAQILGVSGLAHPFWRYRAAGVPLALATDDPGVSRIDITHEYAFATTQYGLRYGALRKLSRASLEHAFLPGRSLWRAPDVFVRAPACRHDTPGVRRLSPPCGRLLRTSRRASVQWRLETRLRRFEHSVAGAARP